MVLARTDHDDEAQTESIEADTEDEPTAASSLRPWLTRSWAS